MKFSIICTRLRGAIGAAMCALFALVAGAVPTIAVVRWQRDSVDAAARMRFTQHADHLRHEVLRRFEGPLAALKGARGSHAASRHIKRNEFRDLVASYELERDFARVRGIGFIERVPRAGIDAFVARERADDAPEFRIRTKGDHDPLYVIKFIEPRARNLPAWGFDVGQEQLRREAAERAVDSGEAALTGPITLVQDDKGTPGFLLYLPAYRTLLPPSERSARRDELAGLYYAPIVTRELLDGVADLFAGDLAFDLVDGASGAAASLIFDTAGSLPDRSAGLPHITDERRVEVGGRDLLLRIASTPRFEAKIDRGVVWMTAATGAALSLLMAVAVWTLGAGRRRAEDLARGITAELDRLACAAQHRDSPPAVAHRGLSATMPSRADAAAALHAVQEAMQRQNDLLVNVLENLPCGVSVFDAELRLVTWNRRMQSLMALPDELMHAHRPHFETFLRFSAARGEFGDGDLEATVARLLDEVRHPPAGKPFERIRRHGVPLEIRRAPMPGGGFVTTYSDISERKRAEVHAQHSAALLRAALDTADEAFVLYDPDDRLVLCNDKYRALYALSAPAIVPGARFEDIVRYGAQHGQYREAVGRVEAWVAERMAAHRAGGRSLLQTLDDGRTIRVLERRMADGHTVGLRIDVTDLERARVAAEDASRAKSRFLANMSHEIRTPMNAVLGMLGLLRRSALAPRQADHAAKAEGAARALLGILDDVLDFSKIEAGKVELEARAFVRDAWLDDVAVVLAASLGAKPVNVLFDVDPELPRVLVGDDMRLRQILVNLGGNAIKFTERGEVIVQLRLIAREHGRVRVRVGVSDTGIGIAPEHQQRIFDAFTQAEASTTRRFGGTGLGLAISARLIKLMGGSLSVESKPGAGSTFAFEIELGQGPLDDDGAGRAPQPMHVLFVDDNACARRVFATAAASLGWHTIAVAGATEALAAVAAPDAAAPLCSAVFIDAQRDGMPASMLASRLRAALPPSTAIVLVAAHALDDDAGRPGGYGATDATLTKPFTARALAAAVHRAHDARRQPLASAPAPRAEPRLAGLTLLVAEDNANNRQIAQDLLGAEGARLALVGDGRAAVDTLLRDPTAFDAVLMDLQMPVMDGLSAAAAIRAEPRLARLPIIAMTANAMASDREACLAAGMNDHVGKPLDVDVLVGTILRHSRPDAACPPARAGAIAAAPATSATSAPDLDIGAAVDRFGGRIDAYLRALRGFLADAPASLAALSELLAAGDRAAAVRLMHSTKGLAATLGANALAHCAQDLERELSQPAADVPPPAANARTATSSADRAATPAPTSAAASATMVARWRDALTPALAALRQAQGGLERRLGSGSAPTPADERPLGVQLEALMAFVAERDMRAEDALDALKAGCRDADPGRVAELEAALSRLDFDRALATCRAWWSQLEDAGLVDAAN